MSQENAEMQQDEVDDIEMDEVGDSEEEEEDEDDMLAEEPADDDEEEAPPSAEEDVAIARRRAIQEIMRDTTINDQEKRMRIQNLMSGGRTAVAPPPAPVLPSAAEANAACVHYERNCNIVAPCCQRVYGCRICHDELSDQGHPPMNRFMIQQVVCKNCNTQQAVSNQCIQCQTVFGEYFCSVCNLFMSMVSVIFIYYCLACAILVADSFYLIHTWNRVCSNNCIARF